MLSAAVIVADKIRPIIADLSCRWGDPLSTSIFKAEKIVGVSFYFEEGLLDSGDEIVLKNGLEKTELVKRNLDGKRVTLASADMVFLVARPSCIS